MELPERKDVSVRETWDMTLLFRSEEEYTDTVEKMKRLAESIATEYKGKLDGPDSIIACLEQYEQFCILLQHTSAYAELSLSVDYTDTLRQDRNAQMTALRAELQSRLSFIENEISAADDTVFAAAIERADRSRYYLEEIYRSKPHRLHPEAEKALAAFSPVLDAPYEIYQTGKLVDMRFDPFEVNGRKFPLGYSLFEDDYEFEADTAVRRAAFRAFSDKLRQYENTTAACYNAFLTRCRIEAQQRGFRSITEADLFRQHISQDLYDRQIDLITELLAPAMRKYARLIARTHGLDRMTFADLKLPLDSGYDPRVTIAESRKLIRSALSVLGEDYAQMVDEAFDQRWFDFAKNKGKDTGGNCESLYGKNSFILLTWNNRMADVFTVAHELGHAGHDRLCSAAQSFYDRECSLYLVEAPSTLNELLLGQYLLKTNSDKRFRRWVLSTLVGNTYYHNFVTHLREAWYQREVLKRIDAGGSVNAEVLNGIFRQNLEVFWGDAVELTEGCELTWMRQMHYYVGLYPYTYSAGLTLATQTATDIQREGAPAVDRWKRMLSAGGTLDPVGLANLAGVDITSDLPLRHAIGVVSDMIDEICALTKELDGIIID
jgi:oligoendopeptidase F